MARRTPSAGAPSGPGAASTRTDKQAIAVPNVETTPDMQQGDRQAMEMAQKIAPIPRVRGARAIGPPAARPPRQTDVGIDPSVFERDSRRPDEPVTQGLDLGPGEGSEILPPSPPQDDRRLLMHKLLDWYGTQEAQQILVEMDEQEMQLSAPMDVAPPLASEIGPVAPEEEPGDLEVFAEEETELDPFEDPEAADVSEIVQPADEPAADEVVAPEAPEGGEVVVE